MSTITTTAMQAFLTNPRLVDELTERWRQASHASTGTSADVIGDATDTLAGALIGPYHHYEDDDAEKPVGTKWLIEVEAAIDAAVMSVWEEHVVPTAVAAVIEKLPSAPDYLRVFPGSDQLRADLALVEASR